MAHTCAYRRGGNDDAARASYEHWSESLDDSEPDWYELNPTEQERWKSIFQAGHKAYRDFIRANG